MKRNRAGYSLVELVAVVSLATIVLATVGVMLHGVFRIQQSMADHRAMLNSLARLAEQFRNDVHSAKRVATSGPAISIELADHKRVEYQRDKVGISRTVRAGDQVLHGDTHELPSEIAGNLTLNFLVTTSATGRQIASMHVGVIPGPKSDTSAERRQFQVDAAVGISADELQMGDADP